MFAGGARWRGPSPPGILHRLFARLAFARANPQPAFAGGYFCARHKAGQRGGSVLMHAFCTLVRRELGAHFFSWTGYVVISAVLFLMGFSFHTLIRDLNAEATDRPLTEVFYLTMYFWLILWIAAPVITMRSFAQEKYSGTFETLMTTPVSDLQVVLAKFTGGMIFYLLMWLPLIGCLVIIRHFSHD